MLLCTHCILHLYQYRNVYGLQHRWIMWHVLHLCRCSLSYLIYLLFCLIRRNPKLWVAINKDCNASAFCFLLELIAYLIYESEPNVGIQIIKGIWSNVGIKKGMWMHTSSKESGDCGFICVTVLNTRIWIQIDIRIWVKIWIWINIEIQTNIRIWIDIRIGVKI